MAKQRQESRGAVVRCPSDTPAMSCPLDDTDAQDYFTKAEWSCMATIEKNRITNMLRNYKLLLAQGFDAKPPGFVLKYETRKKQELKATQIFKSEPSEVSVGQVCAANPTWEVDRVQSSWSACWGENTDSLSLDDENSMKESMLWSNSSTDCNENCSSFCQYCYISKHMNTGNSVKKSLKPKYYCMKKDATLPAKPPNRLSYSFCQCGCQSTINKEPVASKQQHTTNVHCEECGQTFARMKYLKNHLKRFSLSNDVRPFKCTHCSHSFIHAKNLRFHERVHNTSKPVPCCHCLLRFADLTSARAHIDKAHQDRIHICDECGMSYSNLSHFLRHKREVQKRYPHQCFVCGHRYLSAAALARHDLVHRRVRPIRCKICYKSFSSKSHLTKHLNSRKTERKYECKACKVKFLAYKSLRKHERIFNGERPFKCVVCGHAYNSKPRLTIHMKVHYAEQNGI